jgi:hypothetical protein
VGDFLDEFWNDFEVNLKELLKTTIFSGVMPFSLAEDILLSLLLRSELCPEILGSHLSRETGYRN